MKIAVIDHMLNYGGGSRVVRNLLPAIKQLRPEWTITFYTNQAAVNRDGLHSELSPHVEIKGLKSIKIPNLSFFSRFRGATVILSLFQKRFKKLLSFFPYYFSGALGEEIDELAKNHDLLFCTWPYLMECPDLSSSIPLVSNFYDFNFRYYFDGPSMHPVHLKSLDKEFPRWLRRSIPVVPTHFMKRELEKFYPEFKDKANVIHLSSLGAATHINSIEAQRVVESLEIFTPYLLYPCNTCSHKNIGNLLGAFHIIKQKHPHLKLVLAGSGTEYVNGTTETIGLARDMKNKDVIGLGYVSNLQIDALIQCATVVVSTSLYEAGCGPGLDAWNRAVPVAMSNIPPFTEHLEVQGVRAQIFDPKSPAEIAEKIEHILNNPEEAKTDALYSQQKLAEYDWICVAQRYIAIFEKAISEKSLCNVQ